MENSAYAMLGTGQLLLYFMYFNICSATFSTTLTGTLFPNCWYAWLSETGILNVSGNPCKRAASRGVSFLGFFPICSINISLPSL